MGVRVCDFETTTTEEDCRVWAWAKVDVDTLQETCGTDIEGFMESILNQTQTLYFHNLKFDGNFIVYWLMTHDYQWRSGKDERGKRENLPPRTFTTCISDMGAWYSITIQSPLGDYDTSYRIEIRDSLKIIPLGVEEIPGAYGLADEAKGSIDYKAAREKGHVLTPEEKDYVLSDARIVAKAVAILFKNGQNKLTAASNALHDFKKRFSKKDYERLFPALSAEDDELIRKTYKGGWTFRKSHLPQPRNRGRFRI